MNGYLYTWNPKRWVWVDQAEAICRVNSGDPYDMPWSCGRRKNIEIGDIFFLMKLGDDPKGIIGCGYISSLPYPGPHWDPRKAANGEVTFRTDLWFKALSNEPIISFRDLQQRFPTQKWTPEAGGISIEIGMVNELFNDIRQNPKFSFEREAVSNVQHYAEGKPRTLTLKTYDRNPIARQACIKIHGYKCSICGFSFKEIYGEMGATYIEVHHLRPIAEIGEEYIVDPVNDLLPVCANCHRMLHRNRPALSIDELKKNLKSHR